MNIDTDFLLHLNGLMAAIEGPTEIAVAGGAIRDMLFEKEIKDVDVFYSGNITWMPPVWGSKESLHTYKGSDFFLYSELPNGTLNIPVPIQFINVENVQKAIDSFPSSFCKNALFLDKGLHIDMECMSNSSVNMVDYDHLKKETSHHLRMKAKYHDWNFWYVDKEVPF